MSLEYAVLEIVATALAGSLLAMLQPWNLVAGFVIAKHDPRTGIFWRWFILALTLCLALRLGSDMAFGGGERTANAPWRAVWTTFALLWSSLLFVTMRRLWKSTPRKPGAGKA